MSQNNQSTGSQILQSAWARPIDTQTAQQFIGLAQVRQARANQLQREAASLTRIYGPQDPRVLAAQAALQNQRAYASKLGIARDTSSTAAPTAPASGWVLYGHVRNAGLTPAAQFTVFLADQGRAWLTQYGYAFTDQAGYYVLSYTPATHSTEAGQKQAAAAAPLTAYVTVSDPACKLVYADTSPISLPADAAINRDIVLGQGPIGTPPCQEGAAPAVPPAKK